MEALIRPFSRETEIRLAGDEGTGEVGMGEYGFTTPGFQALIAYVWRGGYPKWRDGVRPDYVREMREKLEKSGHWIFDGLVLEP